MDIEQLPVNSDCYAVWEFDDQNLTITHAALSLVLLGNAAFNQDTDGTQLEILDAPKRLRLKINAGQIIQKGVARVEVTATDNTGNVAKRRLTPDMIRFW